MTQHCDIRVTEKGNLDHLRFVWPFILNIIEYWITPAMWHLQNIWWAHSCQKGLKTPFPSHISLPVNSALWITCDLLRFFSLDDVTKRLLERLHSDGHLYTKAERPWHLRILNIYLLSNVLLYVKKRFYILFHIKQVCIYVYKSNIWICVHHWSSFFEMQHKLLQPVTNVFVMLCQWNMSCPKKLRK